MNRGVKFFVIGLIFLLPLTTYARTVQVLMGSNVFNITSNSAARFTSLFASQSITWDTVARSGASGTRDIISAPGVLQNFNVKANYPLGAGSYAVVVLKNGVTTALTCTITDPATTCSDTTDTLRVAVGDQVEVRFTGSGGPSTGVYSTAIDFIPDVSNENLITGTLNENQTAFTYAPLYNRSAFIVVPEASTSQSLFLPSGVLSNLRMSVTTAPGAGTSMLFSIRTNQATTSLACSTVDTGKTCSDTTDFVSIPVGGQVGFSNAPTGAAAANGLLGFGMKFVPTTVGQFFFMGGSGASNEGTATAYLAFSGSGFANGTTTQTGAQMVANAMTINGFSVSRTNIAGGAAIHRAYTLEVNGSATAATCEVVGSARTCSWQGSVTVNQGDLLDYIDTVTGGAGTNAQVHISTVATRAQPPTQQSIIGGFIKILGGFIRIR